MELQVLYSVFCSPAACPLLRASIRASAKRPGFGPRDPVRDRLTPDAIAAMYRAPEFPSSKDLAADAELTVLLQSLLPQEGSLVPVLAAVYMRHVNPPRCLIEAANEPVSLYDTVLKRVLRDAGVVRIPLFYRTPPYPSWILVQHIETQCYYRITGPLLEISNIVYDFNIPDDLSHVRHLVLYNEMLFIDAFLEDMPNLETIMVLDARAFHSESDFKRIENLCRVNLPRLRTFVFDTVDLHQWDMDTNGVTRPGELVRMIDWALQHQVNPFRNLATDRDERLLVLARHVVEHTEKTFRDLQENNDIYSSDEDFVEEYVPYPGRITLLP